jgi:penicillin-binding protein 1C
MHARTYRKLPPWVPGHSGDSAKGELSIVFPESGERVFIPIEMDGSEGTIVLEAAHRNANETLYWDIDGEYIGETRTYHQMESRPRSGTHVLTVTDSRGIRASRTFEVLGE